MGPTSPMDVLGLHFSTLSHNVSVYSSAGDYTLLSYIRACFECLLCVRYSIEEEETLVIKDSKVYDLLVEELSQD